MVVPILFLIAAAIFAVFSLIAGFRRTRSRSWSVLGLMLALCFGGSWICARLTEARTGRAPLGEGDAPAAFLLSVAGWGLVAGIALALVAALSLPADKDRPVPANTPWDIILLGLAAVLAMLFSLG